MSNIIRCMGLGCYEKQCQSCKRLPRNAREEDAAEVWMTPHLVNGPCPEYMPRVIREYRQDEAKAILDEIEARR